MQTLPNRLFYKIGEVAEYLSVEPYVLRYWESEFKLKLSKSKNGQRLYQRKDIEQFVKVKSLLYQEGFTISGARKKLKEKKVETQQLSLQSVWVEADTTANKDQFDKVKKELEGLIEWIDKNPI